MRMLVSLLFLLASSPLWEQRSLGAEEQRGGISSAPLHLRTSAPLSLETFEGDQLLTFPANWQVRGDAEEAAKIYKVAEENGNHFLHARAVGQSVQVGLARPFESSHYPFLSWRWRVEQLPAGADERAKHANDSAAGVYVLFDSHVLPRAIKYVWSSSLPVGTRLQSPAYWWGKTVVLRSGPAEDGTWHQETVNIYEDYKKLFGREPGKVEGIGVLTDSDNTQTRAEADYDDFVLLSSMPADGETPLSVGAAGGL